MRLTAEELEMAKRALGKAMEAGTVIVEVGEPVTAPKKRGRKKGSKNKGPRSDRKNAPKNVRMRLLVAQRRAAGLCGCGKTPEPGRKDCEPCRVVDREYQVQRRRDMVAAGRCWCGGETAPGRKSCTKCMARKRAYRTLPGKKEQIAVGIAKRLQAYREAGLCRCGRKRIEGKGGCERCQAYWREWHARRANRISDCGLRIADLPDASEPGRAVPTRGDTRPTPGGGR